MGNNNSLHQKDSTKKEGIGSEVVDPSVATSPSITSTSSSPDSISTLENDDVDIIWTEASTPKPVVAPQCAEKLDVDIKANEISIDGEDPYADVRERMERLSSENKDRVLNSALGSHVDKTLHISLKSAIECYASYIIAIAVGIVQALYSAFCGILQKKTVKYPSDDRSHFSALLKGVDYFYWTYAVHRANDVFSRPVASSPGVTISVVERSSDDANKTLEVVKIQDKSLDANDERERIADHYSNGEYYVTTDDNKVARKCINTGSYNYLGFADDWTKICSSSVSPKIENFPICVSSSRTEIGTTVLHRELECLLAEFLGKESVFVHSMGYNTNATVIPALVQKGDLLISDELNHSSIVSGAKLSGADVQVFQHDNAKHLEQIARNAIINGQSRSKRPYRRIVVLIEGIYSMEGSYCSLGPIHAICKKYNLFLYLDEAHSIGAMGPTGRGCSEYWGLTGCPDIMMGTFSKSFAGMGGYVAGKKHVIDSVRVHCAGSTYHSAMSPIVCQQVLTALKVRKSLKSA